MGVEDNGDTATKAPGSVTLRVRYFAGARAAAGVGEETIRVSPAAEMVTATDVIATVLSAHGEQLGRVIASSSFLLNGLAVRDRGVEVTEGSDLDVLPPFAGG